MSGGLRPELTHYEHVSEVGNAGTLAVLSDRHHKHSHARRLLAGGAVLKLAHGHHVSTVGATTTIIDRDVPLRDLTPEAQRVTAPPTRAAESAPAAVVTSMSSTTPP